MGLSPSSPRINVLNEHPNYGVQETDFGGQNEINNNKKLLEKYNIPITVEGFVEAVATKSFYNEDIYNFIASQFGDKYKRKDNPLRAHRAIANLRGRQRGFE